MDKVFFVGVLLYVIPLLLYCLLLSYEDLYIRITHGKKFISIRADKWCKCYLDFGCILALVWFLYYILHIFHFVVVIQ